MAAVARPAARAGRGGPGRRRPPPRPADQPPSGPTSSAARRQGRSAAVGVGQGGPVAAGEATDGEGRPRRRRGSTAGGPAPPASRATARRRSTLRAALRRRPNGRSARSATNGTTRSTPTSVSFWTASSGLSPLVEGEGDGERRRRRGDRRRRGPSGSQPRRRSGPAGTAPAPSPTVTGVAGAQPAHPLEVVAVGVVEHRVVEVVDEDEGWARSGPVARRRVSPTRATAIGGGLDLGLSGAPGDGRGEDVVDGAAQRDPHPGLAVDRRRARRSAARDRPRSTSRRSSAATTSRDPLVVERERRRLARSRSRSTPGGGGVVGARPRPGWPAPARRGRRWRSRRR